VNGILLRIPSKMVIHPCKVFNLIDVIGGLARFGWNSSNITEREEASLPVRSGGVLPRFFVTF
jgi:hypothetical protein